MARSSWGWQQGLSVCAFLPRSGLLTSTGLPYGGEALKHTSHLRTSHSPGRDLQVLQTLNRLRGLCVQSCPTPCSPLDCGPPGPLSSGDFSGKNTVPTKAGETFLLCGSRYNPRGTHLVKTQGITYLKHTCTHPLSGSDECKIFIRSMVIWVKTRHFWGASELRPGGPKCRREPPALPKQWGLGLELFEDSELTLGGSWFYLGNKNHCPDMVQFKQVI